MVAADRAGIANNTVVKKRRRTLRPLPPRRVRFLDDTSVVGTVADRSSLSEEEHGRAWYPSRELEGFKIEVRALCRAIRGCRKDRRLLAPAFWSPPPLTRGLELRLSGDRQLNKSLAIWGTLKAQKRSGGDPEFIAAVARVCTSAARELAGAEAERDYLEAYDSDPAAAARFLATKIESTERCPFHLKLRKKDRADSIALPQIPVATTTVVDSSDILVSQKNNRQHIVVPQQTNRQHALRDARLRTITECVQKPRLSRTREESLRFELF